MTIDELLESYREVFALTEAEKGAKFERLMKNFMLTYPVWRNKISRVWRWHEFPFRDELGGVDLGIDLVAETFNGEFWAAQCKFYADTTTVTKKFVDSFISNATRTFNGGKTFSRLFWISTTDRYTKHAREMLKGRTTEVKIIDLAFLRRAQVNWTLLDNGFVREEAVTVRKLRDYQLEAVDKAREYFLTEGNTRGQLIMACGTGKTFTALKIAENLSPDGKILFLVPSISLLGQTLDEWASNADKVINAVCVCSDATASNLDDEIVDVNLPLDAMTDPDKISAAIKSFTGDGLTVVFSTYQSIEVVHQLGLTFDLVICDEAHRTVAALNARERKKISAKKNSALGQHSVFTAVHDEKIIHAKRRMYMTATPKLFKTDVKENAAEKDLTVWSMDDESTFGRQFFTITFAEAAALGYLSEYKVLVFTVAETSLTEKLRRSINDKDDALKTDEALKIVGCIQALSKKLDEKSARLIADDTNPLMHTAVAFCSSIDEAEYFATEFPKVQEQFLADKSDADKNSFVDINADFVYGSRKVGKKSFAMNSAERAAKLHRLKNTPVDGNACNILCNVRCLSEGVDVPALDAVIFLASKRSEVEIVQAVGRVMRTAAHKKFGYIVIPVVVPLNKSPEDALDRNEEFKDVWKIINALRAHDEAMNIEIERIRNTSTAEKILVEPPKPPDENSGTNPVQLTLFNFLSWENFRAEIYARMVEHVGNRLYWIQWAYKVAEIVERHTRRIKELIVDGEHKRAFDEFLAGLRGNINPAVDENEAVDMLAQHLVTRPVFEALFENYNFVKQNPVSQSMQKILDVLDGDGMSKDREIFNRLYKQVRESCSRMGDAASRQRIINNLYGSFFKIALEKTAEKLGIVYTPVEVVDFILRSVDAVLSKHFNRRLTDRNVHVIDPFTGTGTFITRLIESGLIRPDDLERKYLHELHANEIVLLAYYIAAVNIENAFAARADAYRPFDGICFTDTFQLYERGQTDLPLEGVMQANSARVNLQKRTAIKVIVGNPPYSVGQRSASDNNPNQSYDKLEAQIVDTYAKGADVSAKKALYDSYVKAFRWATDRIGDGGVIGFITNANWIDKNSLKGLRKCFAKEFSAIYVFNLRGDQRTQGDESKREGGKIFGSGSRTPVAITILVKDGEHHGDAQIFYRDIGDYLTRDEKLARINATPDVLNGGFEVIVPNDKGDWINQRGDTFDKFFALGDKKHPDNEQTFFVGYSAGIVTARDAWCYNFSRDALAANMQTTIDYYNTHKSDDVDTTKISWSAKTVTNKKSGLVYKFNDMHIVEASYRPFCTTNFYYDGCLNEMTYKMPKLFPTGDDENLLICVPGIGDRRNFSALIVDKVPSYDFFEKAQCFPLYWYTERKGQVPLNFDGKKNPNPKKAFERRDGVTQWILLRAQ
ncbi:MAG: DEAD/DEAH box helicase, partial [Selenomonadaceae bacterium]|nr:DEAD/DEAH box helicase [Selenomonadaceae bacterium]